MRASRMASRWGLWVRFSPPEPPGAQALGQVVWAALRGAEREQSLQHEDTSVPMSPPPLGRSRAVGGAGTEPGQVRLSPHRRCRPCPPRLRSPTTWGLVPTSKPSSSVGPLGSRPQGHSPSPGGLFHCCVRGFSRWSPEELRLMTQESEFLSSSFLLRVGGGG